MGTYSHNADCMPSGDLDRFTFQRLLDLMWLTRGAPYRRMALFSRVSFLLYVLANGTLLQCPYMIQPLWLLDQQWEPRSAIPRCRYKLVQFEKFLLPP